MIHPSKIPAALYAIHNVLYMVRWYIGEGRDAQSLYKLMDVAEYLPWLLVRAEVDSTEEFRDYLGHLGEQFPRLAGVLKRFDEGETWPDAVVLSAEPRAGFPAAVKPSAADREAFLRTIAANGPQLSPPTDLTDAARKVPATG